MNCPPNPPKPPLILYSVYMTQINKFPVEIRNYVRAEKIAFDEFQAYRPDVADVKYKTLRRRWIFARDRRIEAVRKFNLHCV